MADPQPEDLETLALRAAGGSQEALQRVTRALMDPVYRLSLRILGHPADAEDATQEIIVQVITHLGQFERRSTLMTWVYRIAVRHLSRWKTSRGEQRASTVEEVANAIDMGLSATEPTSLPEGDARVLGREVQLACTQGMLLALSREERLAYVLGEVLGANDVLGAELCDISREAFRKRLSRARERLRPLLEERCGLVDPARPCRCPRQAAAKERLLGGVKVRFPVEPLSEDVLAANEALGELLRAGRVFSADPPVRAPRPLWEKLRAVFPELLS